MIFESSGLVELLMGQLVKIAIYAQLSDADQVEVDICAALGQLLQGEATGISLHSKGLWLTSDLQVDALDIDIAHLSLSLPDVLVGRLRLEKPLGLSADLRIDEDSLNRFLNSPPIYDWLQTVVFLKQQQAFSLRPQQIVCRLEDEKILLEVQAQMQYRSPSAIASTAAIALSGVLQVKPQDTSRVLKPGPQQPTLIYLQEARFNPDQMPLLMETATILSWVSQLIGYRRIERDAYSVVVRSIGVEGNALQISLDTQVRRLDPILDRISCATA